MRFYSLLLVLVTILLFSACGGSSFIGTGGSSSKERESSTASIYFEDAKWEQIQGMATKELKPIFLDFYTDWCAPCRWLEQDAFQTEIAARYFNKNLVSKKVNAEKGEGIDLAQEHHIKAYPTVIFLRPNGTELSRHVGMTSASNLVYMAKKAVQQLEVERLAAEKKK